MDNAMRDIINAAREYGFFVHREDVPAFDFDKPNVPIAPAWGDLDLTSIIPVNAHAVLLHVKCAFGLINKDLTIRRKGYTNNFVASRMRQMVANLIYEIDWVVGVGPERILESQRSAGPANLIEIVVKGWWF